MKNLLLKFALALAFIGAIIISSCGSSCEVGNYGSVTVKNETGYKIWVDVTWGNVVENYEKLLSDGSSYKYTKIPAGSIEIWGAFSTSDWAYNVENLSSCENLTYTWYLNKSVSIKGENILMLRVTDSNDKVIFDGLPSGGNKVK